MVGMRNMRAHWVNQVGPRLWAICLAVALVGLVLSKVTAQDIMSPARAAFQGPTILGGYDCVAGVQHRAVENHVQGVRHIPVQHQFRRPDRSACEVVGIVEIKLMEAAIKSVKNEMIDLPNAQMLKSELVNYTGKVDWLALLAHQRSSALNAGKAQFSIGLCDPGRY